MGFLKMFDKLDDIIYEPVKVVCDALRQPLKNIDAGNERKKIELENDIQRRVKILEQELETKRKRDEMQIEMDRKKFEADIAESTEQKNFEREMQKAEFIKKYQEDITRLSAELHQALSDMSVDLRNKTEKMMSVHMREYLDMQSAAKKSMFEDFRQINEIFKDDPENRKIVIEMVKDQCDAIVDTAHKYMESMIRDTENMKANIDAITRQSMDNMNKYLSPMTAKNISYNDANRIER